MGSVKGSFELQEALHPDINTDCGWIGLTLVIAGLLGAVIAGVWLDKTKLFK